MARSHARVWLSIWADRDFLALPMHAQWLYLALPSQENINHAGVIALSPKRWTTLCADRDPKLVDDALDILIRKRFVVVDRETEQLLVRSFIRSDHVDRQPNTLKSACASILLLTSQPIRAALLAELMRLDHARIAAMRTTPGHEPAISVLRSTIAALEADGPPPDHDAVTPSDGYARDGYVSDGYAGDPIASDPSPRTRAGEGEGEGEVVPVGTSSSDVQPRKRGSRIPEDFATAGITPDLVAWARTECPLVDHRRETDKFVDYWLAVPGAKGVKLDWPRTWKNRMRDQQERAEQQQRGRSHLRAVGGPHPPPGYNPDGSPKRDPKTGAWMER